MESTGIKLQGGTPDREGYMSVAESIALVFAAGSETHMEQETIRQAVSQLGKLGSVHDCSISGCNVTMGTGE